MRRKGAPELDMMPEPESSFLWRAYMVLRRSRTAGMGAGPIPFNQIMEYADHCGMGCPVERDRLVRIMGEMDAVEIGMMAAKRRG